MTFVPVPNTALVEVKHFYGSEIVENTLWFENIVDPTEGMLTTLAENVATNWAINQLVYASTGVGMYQVSATSMTSNTSPSVDFTVSPIEFGLIDSPVVPSSVTWTITFRTGNRGRSFRGRNYFIGLTESQVSGNGITSTLANNIISAYETFMAAVSTDGWQHVVASRFSGGAPRTTGVTTPVTSYGYFDLYVDSMRRRLTGRGS